MYTILQILVVVVLVVAVIGVLAWTLFHLVNASDAKTNMGYRTLYNYDEEAARREHHLRQLRFISVFLLVIVVCVVSLFPIGRHLAKNYCLEHDGEWHEWDGGFQWDCTNPNEITTDNNIRVIHAQENE